MGFFRFDRAYSPLGAPAWHAWAGPLGVHVAIVDVQLPGILPIAVPVVVPDWCWNWRS